MAIADELYLRQLQRVFNFVLEAFEVGVESVRIHAVNRQIFFTADSHKIISFQFGGKTSLSKFAYRHAVNLIFYLYLLEFVGVSNPNHYNFAFEKPIYLFIDAYPSIIQVLCIDSLKMSFDCLWISVNLYKQRRYEMHRFFFIMGRWLDNFGGYRKIMEVVFMGWLSDNLFLVGL